MSKGFILCLFCAMLMHAMAVCPNNCSGHGRCNRNGKCTCYRQSVDEGSGTDFIPLEYGGNDCSVRILFSLFIYSDVSIRNTIWTSK